MSSTDWWAVGMALLALVAGAVVLIALGGSRKAPTKPNHARLIGKPGATLDLVDENGTVVCKVILSSVTRDYHGTTAVFEDYFKYVERNRYRA